MHLPVPVAQALEKAIESCLVLDTESRDRLQQLDGKLIRICIDAPELIVDFSVCDGRVFLCCADEAQIDTTIRGSFQSLLSLLRSTDAMYTGDVKLDGDVHVAQSLKDILRELDPDWQQVLDPLLGDILTHRIDQLQARFRRWLGRVREGFEQNSSEYLQEEAQVLAPDSEIERYCRDVDECRASLDRLLARLEILETARKSTSDEGNRC